MAKKSAKPSSCTIRAETHSHKLGRTTNASTHLHAFTDMRFLACAIQGDLRWRLTTSCAIHHRYSTKPPAWCRRLPDTAFLKLRASNANLKSRTDLLSSSSECRVASEILLLSFLVPTDDVCLAQVGTTLPDFDVEASCQGHVLEVLSDCFGPGAVKQLVAARVGARSVLDQRLPV
ncbi:unnamed protein product [Polarella glacialis]|uniref:Uncharacterized protein n=1 Tax=Polarella glacialis TaxID=89957 RepID=A0A813J6J5_POLGL|nr:unnamed protein product [Polarella glacialis]